MPRRAATFDAENLDVPGSRVDSNTSAKMAVMALFLTRFALLAQFTHSPRMAQVMAHAAGETLDLHRRMLAA
jgi:hypothetical protein